MPSVNKSTIVLQLGGSPPDHLQRVDLVISAQEFCRSVYEDFGLSVHDSQICAYDPVAEKGSCHVCFLKLLNN